MSAWCSVTALAANFCAAFLAAGRSSAASADEICSYWGRRTSGSSAALTAAVSPIRTTTPANQRGIVIGNYDTPMSGSSLGKTFQVRPAIEGKQKPAGDGRGG